MNEFLYSRLLLGGIERSADKVGYIDNTGEETFASHYDRSARISGGFDSHGIRAGDRVAVVADASPTYFAVVNAGLLVGVVPVPVNTRLSIPEIVHVLLDADPVAVFVDKAFAARTDLAEIRSAVPQLRLIIGLDDGIPGADLAVDELIRTSEPRGPQDLDESATALLLYTGGTTGVPKGVALSNRNLYAFVNSVGLSQDVFREDAVALQTGPLYHIAGIAPAASFASFGNASVWRPVFTVEQALVDIETYAATHVAMVTKLLQMTLDHPNFDATRLSSVSHINYGGSAIPQVLLQRLLDAFPGVRICQSYGMTEAGAVSVLNHEDHLRGARLGSMGRPYPGMQVRILDYEGVERPRSVSGEICVRGPALSNGYWGKPQETAESRRGDWFRTGDGGYLDEDGYLFLTDRIKDMIKSGGENVFSKEVELVIADLPGVMQVAVIGLPSDEWGEQVHAVVVPAPGVEIDPADVQAFVGDRIARFKVPKSVEIRTEPLPMSAGMKVQKNILREQYRARGEAD